MPRRQIVVCCSEWMGLSDSLSLSLWSTVHTGLKSLLRLPSSKCSLKMNQHSETAWPVSCLRYFRRHTLFGCRAEIWDRFWWSCHVLLVWEPGRGWTCRPFRTALRFALLAAPRPFLQKFKGKSMMQRLKFQWFISVINWHTAVIGAHRRCFLSNFDDVLIRQLSKQINKTYKSLMETFVIFIETQI